MVLKIDAKFEGKIACNFKKDMRNSTNFNRLKKGNFILESKMGELNQNSKQPDQPAAV